MPAGVACVTQSKLLYLPHHRQIPVQPTTHPHRDLQPVAECSAWQEKPDPHKCHHVGHRCTPVFTIDTYMIARRLQPTELALQLAKSSVCSPLVTCKHHTDDVKNTPRIVTESTRIVPLTSIFFCQIVRFFIAESKSPRFIIYT